jgi:hypothetical protein
VFGAHSSPERGDEAKNILLESGLVAARPNDVHMDVAVGKVPQR